MPNVAQFEPVSWWWTRNRIGQALQERYQVPKELPSELLTLVRKLDDRDWLLPSVSRENDVDLFGGLVWPHRAEYAPEDQLDSGEIAFNTAMAHIGSFSLWAETTRKPWSSGLAFHRLT